MFVFLNKNEQQWDIEDSKNQIWKCVYSTLIFLYALDLSVNFVGVYYEN